MKNMIRSSVLSFLLIAVSMAFGGVPPLTVTVSDAGGKAAFKGSTDRSGAFATASLKPGNYVVQFSSNNAALKGKNYAVVVSAGTKKVSASAVPGEKFAGGGVAMKVAVGNVLSITGQVSPGKEASANVSSNARVKIVNGKKYVWKGPETGSNFSGRWEEEGRASANRVESVDSASLLDTGKRR